MDLERFESWKKSIFSTLSLAHLDEIRVSLFGKNGEVTQALKELSTYSVEEKKEKGQQLNQIKEYLLKFLLEQKNNLHDIFKKEKMSQEGIDLTLPVYDYENGTLHPLTKLQEHIASYFLNQGFSIADGPEIEDTFHNFDALNVPSHHPSRQTSDTFYVDDSPFLLRTHTSNLQIRFLEKTPPPTRMITMGRVYRNDSVDATHTPMFHQLDGLVIEPGIHMGHLKGCLTGFLRYIFECDNLPLRFRPSFFPFTEPSAEVDICCSRQNGVLKMDPEGTWMEILGCGMVHPHVFKNVGLDPAIYQGFAFGIGIERLLMLKHGLSDIRPIYEGDIRWLHRFGTSASIF